MKRLFFFLLLMILLQNNHIVYAGETQEWPPLTGKAGENITWTFDPGTRALSLTGTGDMYKHKYQEAYLYPWYSYRTKIKSLSISEGITSIDAYAFFWSENLTQVTIPSSVVSVGEYAFEQCIRLTQVNLQEGISSIGDNAFDRCNSLQTITLPASLISLGSNAFFRAEALREINVADGNRNFSSVNGVLYNKSGTELLRCPPVTGSVFEIPDGVIEIGPYAFANCQKMKEIHFSDQLLRIYSCGFWECIGLTSVEFPKNLSSIRSLAFGYCTSLASVVLPSNLTSMAENAFQDCAHTFTIYGLPGTYAETYAAANGYSFAVTEHDHQYGSWIVKMAATCTGRGAQERICSICGGVETKTIPAKEHTPVSDPAVAAACTSGGKTAGSHCSVCGAVLTPQKTVAALGHKWGRFTVSKAATALELGEETRICSRCGKKETKEIIKLGAGGKLSPSSIVIYTGGSIKQLAVSGITSGDAILQWTSSNQKVASVTPAGTVTGRKAGITYITVTLKSGLTASAKVKVLEEKTQNDSSKPETKISKGSSTSTRTAVRIKAKKIKGLKKKLVIKKGKTIRLKPKLIPKNSTDKIKYKSSNKKIAIVSQKGVIKAKKAGKVKITVTAGKVKFVIRVTVKR